MIAFTVGYFLKFAAFASGIQLKVDGLLSLSLSPSLFPLFPLLLSLSLSSMVRVCIREQALAGDAQLFVKHVVIDVPLYNVRDGT